MAEHDLAESHPSRAVRDAIADDVARLLKLVRRLEHENAALRRELAAARPVAV